MKRPAQRLPARLQPLTHRELERVTGGKGDLDRVRDFGVATKDAMHEGANGPSVS